MSLTRLKGRGQMINPSFHSPEMGKKRPDGAKPNNNQRNQRYCNATKAKVKEAGVIEVTVGSSSHILQ